MPHLYLIMTFNRQTCSIPNTAHFKNQAKLQHCDDQLTLLSLHHISLEYYLPWHPGGDLQLTWQIGKEEGVHQHLPSDARIIHS